MASLRAVGKTLQLLLNCLATLSELLRQVLSCGPCSSQRTFSMRQYKLHWGDWAICGWHTGSSLLSAGRLQSLAEQQGEKLVLTAPEFVPAGFSNGCVRVIIPKVLKRVSVFTTVYFKPVVVQNTR